MRVVRRWTTASIISLLLQVTALGCFLVFRLVCGVLRISRLLCFTVAEDTDTSGKVDVSVLAGNLDDPRWTAVALSQ